MRITGHRPGRYRLLAAGAACATLLAACGSGGGGSGASSGGGGNQSAASAPTATGVTKSSITIGATVPLTGAAAPGYSEIAPAMNAVFKWVNAHGGVYGRKIVYKYLDDKYNPATTAKLTRKLVLTTHIFADVGSLGTPTDLAIQKYLHAQKVPHLFIESGCNCWSTSKYPTELGWQPPYTVDGKILGTYIKQHLANEKIGELYQNTEFGKDFMKGIEAEVPASEIVSKQSYDVTTLSGAMTTQMSALKAAGAQVVVMATIPAGTALAMLPAASIGFFPQYVIDNVGADAPTVGPLLSSFTQTATHTSSMASAATQLLNGVITNIYQPFEGTTANPWVQVETKILKDYTSSLYSKFGLDGNTEYGVALGYTFVQALQAAGKTLTRTSLMKAIDTKAKTFSTPGLVPLNYSKTVHYGYEGSEVVQLTAKAGTFTTPTGTWPDGKVLSPVYTSTVTSGAVKKYTGKQQSVPSKLQKTA
ncbi:MAG: ABC transporter substrate-binding protein [Acidimicrobiales bacterium]